MCSERPAKPSRAVLPTQSSRAVRAWAGVPRRYRQMSGRRVGGDVSSAGGRRAAFAVGGDSRHCSRRPASAVRRLAVAKPGWCPVAAQPALPGGRQRGSMQAPNRDAWPEPPIRNGQSGMINPAPPIRSCPFRTDNRCARPSTRSKRRVGAHLNRSVHFPHKTRRIAKTRSRNRADFPTEMSTG